jgi:uncharacterized protein (TIGR00297 family)
MSSHPNRSPASPGRTQALLWQSRLVLAVTILGASASLLFPWMEFHRLPREQMLIAFTGAALGCLLGLIVWRLRAATPGAALTGALFTAALFYATPGWHTLLWPLLALFLLTFAATRFGRSRKEELQIAEERTGRTASQVAANLGAAALASIPVQAGRFFILSPPMLGRPMLVASAAALAEATADTLSSELGEILGGEPLLLTTLRRVPPGTDGAISLAGTLSGCAGAAAISLIAVAVLPLSWKEGAAAFAGGVFGLFFDSLLGATLERRGWLNNDAVNFTSTCAAALCGAIISLAR